jgi:hypothetical protein
VANFLEFVFPFAGAEEEDEDEDDEEAFVDFNRLCTSASSLKLLLFASACASVRAFALKNLLSCAVQNSLAVE